MQTDATINMRDYIDTLLGERDKRFSQAMESSKLAVEKAEQSTEKRLGLLNEFRAQAKDESSKYALKETVSAESLRTDLIQTQLARLYGGMLVIGAIGVANLVRLFYVHQ